VQFSDDDDSDNDHSDNREDHRKTDPIRKNTLSSGEVTVISSHDAGNDTLGRKRFKHKTVTNIFSSDPITSEDKHEEKKDVNLAFRIEALKIAKKARDMREQNAKKFNSSDRSKSKSLFHQLRKFKSLPNLSAIKNAAMKRSKSKMDMSLEVQKDCGNFHEGKFGLNINTYSNRKSSTTSKELLNKVGNFMYSRSNKS